MPMAREDAFCPAASASYARITSLVYRVSRRACSGVSDVPSEATALSKPA